MLTVQPFSLVITFLTLEIFITRFSELVLEYSCYVSDILIYYKKKKVSYCLYYVVVNVPRVVGAHPNQNIACILPIPFYFSMIFCT